MPTEAVDASRKSRLLVVDDEPRMRHSVSVLVGELGHEVVACAGGLEALRLLDERSFDLLLLDLHLPDLDGFAIMRSIREQQIDVGIVVLSADSEIDSAIDALRCGAANFLRKPYEPAEFLRVVEELLARRRLQAVNRDMGRRLEQSEKIHRYLVEHSLDIIYTLDEEGLFSFVNERVETVLGFPRDELIGQPWTMLVYDPDLPKAERSFNERRTGDRATTNFELRLRLRPGSQAAAEATHPYRTVVLNAVGIYHHPLGEDDGFGGTYGVARDISERKAAEERIAYQAYHDQLTGLPNRALFTDRLNLALAASQRHGKPLAVLFVDLDRFKFINDSLGHQAGDRLLQAVASRLRHCLRGGDTMARFGGDEFVVLLSEVEGPEGAAAAARKILDELKASFAIAGETVTIGASIGIALSPEDGITAEEILQHADIAMYHVKWGGKNSYRFYSRSMNEAFHQRLSIESDLRRALESGNLVLHFQPQVDLVSRRIVGFEALVRLRHPGKGIMLPDCFIPLAEETGLIAGLSHWVLDESCRHLRRCIDAGHRDLRIAVNMSPQVVERADFVDSVLAAIARHDVPPGSLEIEITESLFLRDSEHTIAKLKRLSDLAINISIDDFGTRYSSLAYLARFPVHTIKIDRSFVGGMGQGEKQLALVGAIVGIADGFGLKIVAEGVETREQMQLLHQMHCSRMQGFLFSRPCAADEMLALLANADRLFASIEDARDLLAG
jgi:diguanylate cyclase (GGDEF)-like protein/PAS domain S-box-containing protein